MLLISIDRPEKLNATDERLHSELASVWREVARDGDANAVVVTGAGRAFSAGGDLEMVDRMSGDYRRVAAMAGEAAELVLSMIDCEVPIISAINGTAVGAGSKLQFLRRTDPGGASNSTIKNDCPLPRWVKIVRSGQRSTRRSTFGSTRGSQGVSHSAPGSNILCMSTQRCTHVRPSGP